jgi:hypothetical protein
VILRQQAECFVHSNVKGLGAEATERQADWQQEKVHRAELEQVGPQ